MTSAESNRPESGSEISRKKFLGVAGAGAAAGLSACAASPMSESVSPQQAVREIRTDVVVVGGGMGGLTAAVRAARQGADVVVLEKAAEPGGTMRESAGGVWTYESYEAMRQDAPDANPELQRVHWETLPDAFEWYLSMGAPVGEARGNPRSRRIAPVAFTNFMISDLESNGGRVLVETPMIRILTNPGYEVIGVLAQSPDGPVKVLGNATVVATGGWAGNAQMVQANISRMFGSMHQRNCGYNGLQPPLTGDGLIAATDIGAGLSSGGFDAFYGHVLPARPARFTHPLINYSLYHGNWCVALNVYGRRFTDESRGRLGDRKLAGGPGEQILCQESCRQPEATVSYIWDERINQDEALAENNLGDIDKYEAFRQAGAPVARAETLDGLASQMERWGRGFPADVVRKTLQDYNTAAENGTSHKLDPPKMSAEHAVPLSEPPFYAVLGQSGITGPHGGLDVNTRGQVLSRGKYPIPGLYAAGIDVGNIGTYVYMGFLGIGATFGYISGASAAAHPAPSGGWQVGTLT